MSDTVIRVENLSKRYVLGSRASGTARYDTFRDALVRAVKRPFARLRSTNHDSPSTIHDSEFWALRDVSFEVKRGEVLGIIGRNGAGKSTLLKILSRITEPTSGRVTVRGRIASLLEVGTGFHPELSGRENIFLNGVILGLTRAEVKARFDEIVAFAEVEKFLDTPVKHYSSGMYVRLAFAVAAHLDPEILIVDEVLAVGDMDFQRKCLGKMQSVARGGENTVLFVSHNMSAVSRLCTRGLYLERGSVTLSGSIESVVTAYQGSASRSTVELGHDSSKPRIVSVSVDSVALNRGDLSIEVGFDSPRMLSSVAVGVVVSSQTGTPLFGFDTTMSPGYEARPARRGSVTLHVRDVPLYAGLYRASIWFGEGKENLDQAPDAVDFELVSPHALPPGVSAEVAGHTRVNGRWDLQVDESWSDPGLAN